MICVFFLHTSRSLYRDCLSYPSDNYNFVVNHLKLSGEGLVTINADSSTIELHLARICTVQVCGELCLPAEALEMLMQIEIKMDGTVLHLAGACPSPALCWQSAHDCATKEISKLIHLNTWPRKIGDCFSAGSVG